MKRKAISVLVATVLAFSLLPAVAAFAAVSGTANLAVGKDMFPGTGRDYSITVTNSNLLLQSRANAIRILLPSGSGVKNTTTAPTPPDGWNVTVTRTTTAQALTYTAATGNLGLAGGSSVTFPFKADVTAPPSGDRAAVFQVALSDDGGATSTPATGNLTSTIRVLELVGGLLPTAPAGVRDGSGTGGQAITMGMSVKNHAASALTVTPNITSNGGETISQPAPASVPAGGTTAFSVPVTLPDVTANRVSRFTATATSGNSSSGETLYDFAIQTKPNLTLTTSSFSPRNVNTGPVAKTFTMNVNKTGAPTLNLSGGSLQFAGNDVPLAVPVSFNPGTQNNVGLSWGPKTISGPNGGHDAVFVFTGKDDNDAPFTRTVDVAQLINIDNLAPTVTVDVELPAGQTAVKNGDRLTVTGTIDDAEATLDYVEIRPNVGAPIPVTATRSGTTFEGTSTVNFAAGATSFIVVAQATDTAQNSGGASSASSLIDNIVPAFNYAATINLRQIGVSFSENNVVSGGCDPSLWSVEDNIVVNVLNDNGDAGVTECTASSNNSRILVLATDLANSDAEPRVTYTQRALTTSPARDGAANNAPTATVKAIVGIAPSVPDVIAVFRNTGGDGSNRETATFDEDTYFTRFGGSDLVVEFAGARTGYTVQVLDGNNNVIKSERVTFPESGNPEVRVPIGTAAGNYVRKLRLVNANNIPGDVAAMNITLDQTLPQIAGATKTAATSVNVNFSEKISHGSDFAFDWLPYENVADAEGGRQYYNVDRVTGSGASRTLEVSTFANNGPFGGAEYLLISGGERYRDRAGNQLADTIVNL